MGPDDGSGQRAARAALRRRAAALLGVGALVLVLAGCTPPSSPAPVIQVRAEDVMPFQPSNSVWYSASDLRAERPFARWEQQRDRIRLVTWPTTCARVPVSIAFTPPGSTVRVGTGRAPRSEGPRQCSPGHVLTSTFVASRALRRDRPTTLLLDGRPVVLPPAPGMTAAPVSAAISRAGDAHPLRQVDRPLPQYSVRYFPWNLTAPVAPATRSVPIGWIGGTCGPNASVVHVDETASTVTIDLALAPPPLRPTTPPRRSQRVFCAGVGIGLSTTVRLARPLGTRTLQQHEWVHRPADQNAY